MIDMASVYAKRFEKNPQMLQAAVMGQSPDPKLDPYTALNALRLIKESNMMAMSRQAQQPTSSPSLVAENMAPQMGLGAMVPGTMGQAPQGQAPQGQAPVMQAASGGLASMPTPEYEYAKGGIVAFQSGGLNRELTLPPGTPYDEEETGTYASGDPNSSAISRAQEALDRYMDFEPKEMTEKEQEAFLDRYMARVKKAGGDDIYAPAKEKLVAREAALAGDRRYGEGMALLTAAGKILKGRSLAEGASEALPAYAQQLGEVRRAEREEKRAIEQMNFALNDAQRKERMGDARGAQAALEAARKFQQDANKAQGDKLRYGADIAARTVGYSKTSGKGAGGLKWQEQVLQSNIDYLKTTEKPKEGETPEAFDARIRKQASDIVAPLLKTSFSTSENAPNKQAAALAPVQQRVDAKVSQDIADFKSFSPEGAAYRRAVKAGAKDEAARLLREAEKEFRATHERTEGLISGGNKAEAGTADNPIVIK
jgi:hypothetical protein